MGERKPKSGRSKTSPETCKRTAQEIEALKRRIQGEELYPIAVDHGVTVSCVSRRIQKCLKEAAEERLELGDQLLDLWLARVDRILLSMAPKVEEGSARHAEVALKAIAQGAKLLGLEAPIKVEVTDPDEALKMAADALGLDVETVAAAVTTTGEEPPGGG